MGKPLSDEKIMRMYRMIKSGEYSGNDIALTLDINRVTVSKYTQALKDGGVVPRVTEARKTERKIMKMIDDGLSAEEIMRQMGISEDYLEELALKAMKQDVGQTLPGTKYEFLQTHWHFDPETIYRKKQVSKDGYRIVHKGEKGQLRTPYRPDQIFR